MEEVRRRLEKTSAKIHLIKGDTRKTLPMMLSFLPKMDFIFIDGGHSFKVVSSDWESSKRLMHEKTIVVFDDVECVGVKKVINSIDRQQYELWVLPGFGFHSPYLVAVWHRNYQNPITL
jgi:predicted O-methyltransferase YrrM